MAKSKNKQRREKRKMKARKNTVTTTNNFKSMTPKIPSCHTGMSEVYTNDETGCSLFIGGWKHGASYNEDTFVIDLTGDEDKYSSTPRAYGKQAEKLMEAVTPAHGGWLSLPFPDYNTPKNMRTYEQWFKMAEGIREILEEQDVLVACLGGHGRSGLFCAIVGYILNSGEGWESPVDKIRGIHCQMAVETDAQEQFVYDILGLDLIANPKDYNTGWTDYDILDKADYFSWSACPKCSTMTAYTKTRGMCLKCQDEAEAKSIVVMDITTEMLASVDCTCKKPNCLGTWVAEKCGHAVHDKLVIDGYCETCCEDKAKKVAEQNSFLDDTDKTPSTKCEICGTVSAANAFWTGLCVGCAMQFENDETPTVHDTLTDNFMFIQHYCKDTACKGICVADICKHAVHNRYVVDGLCPQCYTKREMTKIRQQSETHDRKEEK